VTLGGTFRVRTEEDDGVSRAVHRVGHVRTDRVVGVVQQICSIGPFKFQNRIVSGWTIPGCLISC
jgi:hypothetical protein